MLCGNEASRKAIRASQLFEPIHYIISLIRPTREQVMVVEVHQSATTMAKAAIECDGTSGRSTASVRNVFPYGTVYGTDFIYTFLLNNVRGIPHAVHVGEHVQSAHKYSTSPSQTGGFAGVLRSTPPGATGILSWVSSLRQRSFCRKPSR